MPHNMMMYNTTTGHEMKAYSSRSSISGFPVDLLNRSITSPFGGINNTVTEGHVWENDKFNSSLMLGEQPLGM